MVDQDNIKGDAVCGIAGILTFNESPVAVDDISLLTDALAHRGRDNAAYRVGGIPGHAISSYSGIALGHRRLSIIDLSSAAAQPMSSLNSSASIVYNGELYNYRELRAELIASGFKFRTNSDSEVVLVAYDAWGEACLQRFNGMFAFAIWDEAQQGLFCARDPIGIKPFYYILTSDRLMFASESQALAKLQGSALDAKAVACYFLSMYVPRQLSVYEGVQKLLPGHSMRITRDGRVTVQRYWRIPETRGRHVSTREAAQELTELLDQAVKAQLRSDVPVGALLSGGFDSGMIVASASRTGVPLHTYTVGFDDGQQASELPIARAMASRYRSNHHEKVIAGNEVLGFLGGAIASMSEPVADSAIVPTYCLSGMAADDGVKVLLCGTGGDEVFAGYSRYVASSLQRRVLLSLPSALRTVLANTVFAQSLVGARLRYPSIDMMVYAGGSPRLARHLFEDERAFYCFLEELGDCVFPERAVGPTGLYEHMAFDLQVYLPDLLLMLLDQLTMAHTIEGRVPLLDIDLIAACYSLSPEMHASPTQPTTRRLMRQMAIDRVDVRTFSVRKLGFSGPVESWISQNRLAFRERIMSAREIPLIDALPLERLWNAGERSNTRAWAMEMFSIYCFSGWCEAHA